VAHIFGLTNLERNLLIRYFMIGRIDPKFILDLEDSYHTSSSRTGKSFDFQSLLEEKLDVSKPLQMIAIQLLNQAIDALLSINDRHEGNESFLLPSSPFDPPVKSPPPLQPPFQTVSPHVPAVSNNLHEKKDFDPIIEEAARVNGVEPGLIRAVIQVESGGNPLAVSPAGAQGLMQLMPATGGELGVNNPFDPVQNIMAGTRYLRQLLDRYRGDVRLALAAYNWGMGNLEKRPEYMPNETQRYIVKVESIYRSKLEASQRVS
jgi:hypothetical protein